jgi:hypothetical protein
VADAAALRWRRWLPAWPAAGVAMSLMSLAGMSLAQKRAFVEDSISANKLVVSEE